MTLIRLNNTIDPNEIITYAILMNVFKYILLAIAIGLALYLIIKAACKSATKKNTEEIDYNRLATLIADELCRRMNITEENDYATYKSATNTAAEPKGSDRDRAPDLNASRQT